MAKASKKKAPVQLVDEVDEQAASEVEEQPAEQSEPAADEGVELAIDEAPIAPVSPGVSVHAKLPEGFYRLGQKFTQEPKVFGPGELSDAQLGVLLAEKMLVVKVL